jgi:hypothetical protein
MENHVCVSCGNNFGHNAIEILDSPSFLNRKCDKCGIEVTLTDQELIYVKNSLLGFNGDLERMEKRWFSDPDWFLIAERMSKLFPDDTELSDLVKRIRFYKRKKQRYEIRGNNIQFYDDIGLNSLTREDINDAVREWQHKSENQAKSEFFANLFSGKKAQERIIEKVIIPEGVETLGDSIFENIPARQIILPTTLREVPAEAFAGSRIESAWIPERVKSIPWGAVFYECRHLTMAKIHATITKLPVNFFYGCEKLIHAFLPNTLEIIDDGAFWGCKSLEKVLLPDKLTHIGNNAFKGCVSLTKLSVPVHVIFIADNAFDECNDDLIFECEGYAYYYLKTKGFKVIEKI